MDSDKLERAFRELLEGIGENTGREGLRDTPKRAAEAMKFLAKGYGQDAEKAINGAVFTSQVEDMIIAKDIELYSLCEHHLLPFIGRCHVGYIPHGKIIGLSKIPRVVEVFARRLQMQERLTREVAEAIMKYTEAKGVGVVVEAKHLCMMMRGVEKQNSVMKTSCMLGLFREREATRLEFLSLIEQP